MDHGLAAEIKSIAESGAAFAADPAPARLVRTESALALIRRTLRTRIAFLERTCDEAQANRHWAILTRYEAALLEARDTLIGLSSMPDGRADSRARRLSQGHAGE